MKKLTALLGLLIAVSMTVCGQTNTKEMKSQNPKTAVVYFSATGITRAEAELIAKAEQAPLIEIQPVEPYTAADLDWTNSRSRSSRENSDKNARPAVRPVNFDFAGCDTIFLGYPIWWDVAPRVVNTFIENHDLKGKTVIPFATSGGSTINNSVRELRRLYPDIKWEEGRLLNGANASSVGIWVDSLK